MTRKASLDQGGQYSTYDALGRSTLRNADGSVAGPEAGSTSFAGPNHTYSVFNGEEWETKENPDPNQKFGFQPRAQFKPGSDREVVKAGWTNETKTIPSQGDPPQMFWVDDNGNPTLPPGEQAAKLRDKAALIALIESL